jgi:hypothetical protein
MTDRRWHWVSKWSDFLPMDVPAPLVTHYDLWKLLGIDDAPEEEQRAVIAEWLRHNEPSPMLRYCLEKEGYLADAAS